ncbi:MAG: hypothetical protein M1834_003280 [Cirrosporium novae-zelandiae]|nr:MAG: hypothetical protein M1834_003280 [Cirrosporium novae-zelandiae]
MAEVLSVDLVGWGGMTKYWWQWILIVLAILTIALGSSYIIYLIIKQLIHYLKRAPPEIKTPSAIQNLFATLSNTFPPLVSEKGSKNRPTKFGVYLGAFTNPQTEQELQLLSRWDLLILDPFQSGIQNALSSSQLFGHQNFVARLDFDKLIDKTAADSLKTLSEALSKLAENIRLHCYKSEAQAPIFNGLLLARWEERLSGPVFRDLVDFLAGLGFQIYVEASPPQFLDDSSILQLSSISGVIVRNATILQNGERRDYFQMEKMKPTLKAFVAESCMRDFLVMMWETVDDDVQISNAVARRSFRWSSFYNAITFICSASSLVDSQLSTDCHEPLGAFDWLKEATVMKIHKIWRANTGLTANAKSDLSACKALETMIPSMGALSSSTTIAEKEKIYCPNTLPSLPERLIHSRRVRGNPLSYGPSGKPYNCLGCFPLGTHANSSTFSEILLTQERLRSKGLLDKLSSSKLQRLGILLREFHDHLLVTQWSHSFPILQALRQLSEGLNKDSAEAGSVQIYVGIDSGFQKKSDSRFWGVYRSDTFSGMDLYISKNAQDQASTVLHTWLSSQGCPRNQCYLAELALSDWSQKSGRFRLPERLCQDIELLNPSECISFFRHLKLSECEVDPLLGQIQSLCRFQLMDRPSLAQMKEQNTIAYLDGSVTVQDLLEARLKWYREYGCRCPELSAAVTFFLDVDAQLIAFLKNRDEDSINQFTTILNGMIKDDQIDIFGDLFALSLFCAARKAAFDEVYLEVTDRNPLFNQYSDQAAVFAECFALGSQCEAYFDVSPSAFGKLLSDKFRKYYLRKENQPPLWLDGAPSFATAYGAAELDIDPNAKPHKMNEATQFTFLSVFAIPALVDIMMLVFTGRGLYLSAFMSIAERQSATVALMISLLLSGAIGTWITCGSTYYLVSMAFTAMNMFIYIRLIAGLAFTLIVGLLCLAIDGASRDFAAGIVFFLYLFALTAYFTILAGLAGLQFPGSAFNSGRKIILFSIPILFISPIVTMWVRNHDTLIYLGVIYAFITILLFGLRRCTTKWATWFHKIVFTNDAELKDWYLKTKAGGDETALPKNEPAALKLARKALLIDVLAETKKGPFSKKTNDEFVRKLAASWEATHFLMDWYCPYSDTAKPIPFSSSWNATTKGSVNVLKQTQKGIRLHSAFVLWHQAGDEIGCGVLYFLVALLDKWTGLAANNPLLGLASGAVQSYRIAVGLGLAYYLIGAVILDTQAQKLHVLAAKTNVSPVATAPDVRQAQRDHARMRNQLYWKTLMHFCFWHVWSLAITASLVWTFQDSRDNTLMFILYVFAYTGLLWYQYTKIFTSRALLPLSIAVLIALPGGIIAKKLQPGFIYTDVLALAIATWTAAIGTLLRTDIRPPKYVDMSPTELDESYHAYSEPWEDEDWSQQELKSLFDSLAALPVDDCFKLEPEIHPGSVVQTTLLNYLTKFGDPAIKKAFPAAPQCVERCIQDWRVGHIGLFLIPRRALAGFSQGIRAISRTNPDGTIQIMIGVGREGEGDRAIDINRFCFDAAQIALHAVSETIYSLPHNHSYLMESLLTPLTEDPVEFLYEDYNRPLLSGSNFSGKYPTASKYWELQQLSYLCFGIRFETEWEDLPGDIRRVFLQRLLGQGSKLSDNQWEWLQVRFCGSDKLDIETFIARCNYGVSLASEHQKAFSNLDDDNLLLDGDADDDNQEQLMFVATDLKPSWSTKALELIRIPMTFILQCVKFFTFAMIAEPELQRELDYVLDEKPVIFRIPAKLFINFVWVYGKCTQRLALPFFLLHGREDVSCLWGDLRGTIIKIKAKSIQVRNSGKIFTSFVSKNKGGYKLHQYEGLLTRQPPEEKDLQSVMTFSRDTLLTNRKEYDKKGLVNEYQYEYVNHQNSSRRVRKQHSRLPISRTCVDGKNQGQIIYYNREGLTEAGSYMKDGNFIRFKYHYRKHARLSEQLLRAEFALGHITVTVSWCAPPTRHQEKTSHWIPHSKVMEATFVIGADIYECKWFYQEDKHHPFILTTLNGDEVLTPPLVEYDYLGILRKPKDCSFLEENPFASFNSLRANPIVRWLGLNTHCFPMSTGRARSQLWKAWKDSASFDGVMVRFLDERLLRRDRLLIPYWRKRDIGNIPAAIQYADINADAITASVDLDDDIASWCPLAIKITDFFHFGSGGDAVANTKPDILHPDTREALHVMALDSGTWPNEGGGVSACRRDLINNLKSIRWHMVVESATDFGIPKHQTEENVQSLKLIPLWGLDLLTPTHGIYQNRLHSEVQNIIRDVPPSDIERHFLPNLAALVKCARAASLDRAAVRQCTRALVNINSYFQGSRHWSQVWKSDIVKSSWRNLWLAEGKAHGQPLPPWFDTELPTLTHLDTALELWFRYLFIFSIPIPDNIPAVFQASHHSVSATYGVICKIKHGCQLQIWDHAISWRETNLCLSSALCKLPPFVRNALLGLMRITSVLVLHHADVILPCADFFNPGWEVQIGTCQGALEHPSSFARKVDPIVNGIPNMEKFAPIKEVKSKKPTVTMLSHVWFAKDIKTALLAADIIVNQWGFEDYQLDIYGALDKAPTYSTECQEVASSKGLRKNVNLCGPSDALKVLEKTWVFLNSSISEGLPLALGEAALTGAPIVCTDVGASMRVLSNPEDFKRYSAVVAPNDATALARAQINLLGMLDEWSAYAGDAPGEVVPTLPTSPSPDDVAKITKRMYAKSGQLRKLGMKARDIIQRSFSGERYLREHEQMLWVGKARNQMVTGTLEVPLPLQRSGYATPVDSETMTFPKPALPPWRNSWRNSRSPSPSRSSTPRRRSPAPSFSPSLGGSTEVERPLRPRSRVSFARKSGDVGRMKLHLREDSRQSTFSHLSSPSVSSTPRRSEVFDPPESPLHRVTRIP